MTANLLEELFHAIVEEARVNEAFGRRLDAILSSAGGRPEHPQARSARRGNRRAAATLDPYEVYRSSGESGLRTALSALDVEKLKDIVAEYDMDRDRLALKWRAPERLIDRIVETVISREEKGDAFTPG